MAACSECGYPAGSHSPRCTAVADQKEREALLVELQEMVDIHQLAADLYAEHVVQVRKLGPRAQMKAVQGMLKTLRPEAKRLRANSAALRRLIDGLNEILRDLPGR